MGYSYGINYRTGRQMLACDNCSTIGGVRKIRCTEVVLGDNHRAPGGNRHAMDYCQPPALCQPCLTKLGGRVKLHARCKEGAARMQAEYDATQAKLDAGDKLVVAGFGDWADWVPAGMVGVAFRGAGYSDEEVVLMAKDDYLLSAFTLAEYRELGVVVDLAVTV